MTRHRQRSRFRANYADTLSLLDRELRMLGAKRVVLQVAFNEGDIRHDGRPRANSRPAHPGVILSFESRHGPLSYPCDRYDNWEDNLRGIALSLEHLRAVDRYGVTRRGEQYRGWAALPPPNITPPQMTLEDAARFVAVHAAALQHINDAVLRLKAGEVGAISILLERAVFDELYRLAARHCHPDTGGSIEMFERLQQAKQALESHFLLET